MSNKGRVKSLKGKETILTPSLGSNGYLQVMLYKGGESENRTVHSLVAESFLNHVRCGHERVCDHINGDKMNNTVGNIKVGSQRDNCTKAERGTLTSRFTGVSYQAKNSKYVSKIRIGKSRVHLGLFESELMASNHYQMALKHLSSFNGDGGEFRELVKSLVQG